MKAYYNEINKYCANWLRNLVADGMIPYGNVDERDIHDVTPKELLAYTQCHFFAGIGGWPLALRLAGWPDDLPVWTGSCPCQPFSQAGKRKGFDDERHLWPAWYWLIEQCRPPIVFGEQVASIQGLAWLDLVSSDLERAGYTVRSADLCAASVGAPHVRQRLWFCATNGRVAYYDGQGWSHSQRRTGSSRKKGHSKFDSSLCGMGNTDGDGCKAGDQTSSPMGYRNAAYAAGWNEYEWIECADGKCRPTEPGVRPLAHGLSKPSPTIGPYGNAIVPQVGAIFVEACMNTVLKKIF